MRLWGRNLSEAVRRVAIELGAFHHELVYGTQVPHTLQGGGPRMCMPEGGRVQGGRLWSRRGTGHSGRGSKTEAHGGEKAQRDTMPSGGQSSAFHRHLREGNFMAAMCRVPHAVCRVPVPYPVPCSLRSVVPSASAQLWTCSRGCPSPSPYLHEECLAGQHLLRGVPCGSPRAHCGNGRW